MFLRIGAAVYRCAGDDTPADSCGMECVYQPETKKKNGSRNANIHKEGNAATEIIFCV
jgi:hypothetical protein